jgi:hypothetical protein
MESDLNAEAARVCRFEHFMNIRTTTHFAIMLALALAQHILGVSIISDFCSCLESHAKSSTDDAFCVIKLLLELVVVVCIMPTLPG